MPGTESIFPLWHVALTAGATFIASLAALIYLERRAASFARREAVFDSLLAGLSVLAWRLAGNVPQLNDDPVPLFSPNDLLCPVITYVVLGLYASLRQPADPIRWERSRALLTTICFLANVILI